MTLTKAQMALIMGGQSGSNTNTQDMPGLRDGYPDSNSTDTSSTEKN